MYVRQFIVPFYSLISDIIGRAVFHRKQYYNILHLSFLARHIKQLIKSYFFLSYLFDISYLFLLNIGSYKALFQNYKGLSFLVYQSCVLFSFVESSAQNGDVYNEPMANFVPQSDQVKLLSSGSLFSKGGGGGTRQICLFIPI